MTRELHEQNHDNQLERFVKICDAIDERMDEIKYELYVGNLKSMTDVQLAWEFADRIGDEVKEFENLMYHYGRKYVEDYLADHYSSCNFERRTQ